MVWHSWTAKTQGKQLPLYKSGGQSILTGSIFRQDKAGKLMLTLRHAEHCMYLQHKA